MKEIRKMTIRELIEKLQELDQDKDILCGDIEDAMDVCGEDYYYFEDYL
jgi:hypothetical protein